jgi:S-formylglutathione hydrolase FrmB
MVKYRLLFQGFALVATTAYAQARPSRFEVSVPDATHAGPLTGRLIVVVSKNAQPEPRLAIGPQGPAMYAIDLEALAPGQPAVVDERALGYPFPLAQLPPGEYTVQAVINVYERARRADGHTIWVPLNDGEQDFFSVSPGNLYSEPQRIRVNDGGTVRLSVTKVVPPQPKPADTEWVKRVRFQSARLTAFWGRPIYVHATVLLPKGYADHPDSRFPTVFTFGHNVPFGFNPDSSRTRGIGTINPVTGVETGFDFYKAWNGDGFPRFIAVSFQQQTPWFPDSYSMNSVNQGPYADAMLQEVIPALEQQFRMIGQPYARLVEGASTGGWQTLALQLKHPDFFGGAWVLQPDPIDFKRYQLIDIYADTNAFVMPNSQFTTTERYFRRSVEGHPLWTVRQLSLFEEVLGTRGRSGYQLGAWEAIYGPIGADGYPKPLWNKLTGTIDKSVAEYMRENGYDLREYAQRNWGTIGPKLAGKLHFFSGDMDDFYLNVAVYRMEEFLKGTTNPKSDATFTYGRPTKGHSWHAFPWAELVRQMGTHVRARLPAGESAARWSY